MRVILRNSARCLLCEEEIVSEYRHDYKHCTCGNVMVDGGNAYIRHGAEDLSAYEDTSEFGPATCEEL